MQWSVSVLHINCHTLPCKNNSFYSLIQIKIYRIWFRFTYDKYYDWSLTNLSLKIVLNYFFSNWPLFPINCIGGVMASVLASSVVDHGFEPRSGQTKDYKIGICCFSANHAALRRKNKSWLARNLGNVSEWGDMSICGRLFQWASTIYKSN